MKLLQAAIRADQELGNRRWIILPLRGLAVVSASMGDARRAARLFGSLEALGEAGSIGMGLPTLAPIDPAEAIAAARASLGEVQFAAAWAEGRAMTLEQAIEYALQEGTAEEAHGSSSNVAPE